MKKIKQSCISYVSSRDAKDLLHLKHTGFGIKTVFQINFNFK